jgi:hypothetical protein
VSVDISWTPPSFDGGTPIVGYLAYVGESSCATSDPSQISCVVSGLVANICCYDMQVQAITAGDSLGTLATWSDDVLGPTPMSPPNPPVAVAAALTTAGAQEGATVAWQQPWGQCSLLNAQGQPARAVCGTNGGFPDGGSAIQSFTVTAEPGGAQCESTQDHCEIDGLDPSLTYSFAVVASNAIGTSVSSSNAVVYLDKYPMSGLLGVASDSTGDLFTVDGTNVIEIAPDGTESDLHLGAATPIGVAVDANGDLFVLDGSTGDVVERAVGGADATVMTGLSDESGVQGNALSMDSNGNLYAVNVGGNDAMMLSPYGTMSTVTDNQLNCVASPVQSMTYAVPLGGPGYIGGSDGHWGVCGGQIWAGIDPGSMPHQDIASAECIFSTPDQDLYLAANGHTLVLTPYGEFGSYELQKIPFVATGVTALPGGSLDFATSSGIWSAAGPVSPQASLSG